MSKSFDMKLFLIGVLSGSKSSQQRHLRQAQIMHVALQKRWHRTNPWTWKRKHVKWFFNYHLKAHSDASKYYYKLTTALIEKRTGKNFLNCPASSKKSLQRNTPSTKPKDI